MDALTDSIESLHPQAALRTPSWLSAPWGFEVSAEAFGFYVVTRGSCWLEVHGCEPVRLEPGDYALVHPGKRHLLRDSRTTPVVPLEEWIEHSPHSSSTSTLIAGTVAVDAVGGNPLIEALPPLLHVAADGGAAFDSALRLLTGAMFGKEPGSAAIARRVSEVLFAQSIAVGSMRARSGWLAAVADPQIGAALSAMHAAPAEEWTVESLAMSAGMSRAAFAARFHALVGEPPLAYLTRHRMHDAALALRTGASAISAIAAAAGYESEAAFNKAFKRTIGVTPGKYRRGTKPNRRRSATAETAPAAPKKRDWWFID